MSHLLLCPYCGGKAAINGYKRKQFGGYFVECSICTANVGKNFCGDGEAGGTVEDHAFDKELEAIAAWNRRVVPENFMLVPAGLDLNAFIEQTQQLLEKSKACTVNPENSHKSEFYTGQSHGIEIVLDALKDVISDTAMNHGWISVNERLPEQNSTYLCYFKNGDIALIEFQDGYFDAGEWRPTHWHPLPLPPDTQEKNNG